MNQAVSQPIRVVIVEDQRVTRDTLRLLFSGTPGFVCAATFGSVEEALSGGAAAAPGVVLLDIGLPGVPGSIGVASLAELWPQAAILMHTVFEEDGKVFESLCRGAVGYVLKRTPPARLIEAVREAHEGGSPMSPEIARRVVGLFRRFEPQSREPGPLAPQELRVLQLLAEGFGYEEAAAELGVTINTVRSYVRRLYEKLQVHTRSAAVAKALRAGLI